MNFQGPQQDVEIKTGEERGTETRKILPATGSSWRGGNAGDGVLAVTAELALSLQFTSGPSPKRGGD